MNPADFAARLPASSRAVCGVLLLLVVAFCAWLWPEWRTNPDLSHGFFAPLIFGLLVWESRRQGTQRWLPAGRWTGLALGATLLGGFLLFAMAGLLAASVAWSHALVLFVLACSLALFLSAGLILLADERQRLVPFNWISLSAIFLWILVAPLPAGTYARLTLALQGWVTGSVLHSLHLLGIPARQHGNIIELARTTVGVEEACSGIRSLLSCVYAGFFFAAWQIRRPAARIALIVAAPLLALGMNYLRSLTLTLLANSGTNISGFWHDATGFAILGVTALLLAGLAITLEAGAPVRTAEPPLPAAPLPRGPRRFFWTLIAATVALGLFFFASSRPSLHEGRSPPDLFALLPAGASGWEVVAPKNLYQFADILQTSHLVERTYLRQTNATDFTQFTVYVAYWAAGQASVSRVASHTPDACWPGAGWTLHPLIDAQEAPVLPDHRIAPGEHRLFENTGGFRQNVWFWHIYDGRVIRYRDPYSVPALLRIALEYGFRRQGDQVFVRISSNKTWHELTDEPLVRDILANLTTLGL
jgi:exosortase